VGRGLGAILLSQPVQPHGQARGGDELARWVRLARELDCTLLIDEFYSHYIWNAPGRPAPMESAARYVEDVDRDPVVIFDGLTKNWRYPGWRVTWTVGPAPGHRRVASAGSFLDGGGSKPMQRAASRCSPSTPAPRPRPSTRPSAQARQLLLAGCAPRRRVDRVPEGTSTSGARGATSRRRSTTAWASSAPRSPRRSSPSPGSSST
jgi:N-succinyldiaminopimelate aminotransferase